MSTVNVNVIFVGVELFTPADEAEVSSAIATTRGLYSQVGLGLGTILFFAIPLAQTRGREDIDDDGEAQALTDEWTVDNLALDLFFVRTYAGATVGLSRVDGPCDKNAKGMDGSVVAVEESVTATGFAAAHELAHYLGLGHEKTDPTNLMFTSFPNGGILRVDQGNNMKDHCFVF
jgi:hypothetical protein